MQPIIHKAAIVLELNPVSAGISPGDRATLSVNTDSSVSVFIERPSRLPFGFGKPRIFPVGKLGVRASEILLPALERKAELRVRVVEVEPAHISPSGQATVCISVWGNVADLDRQRSSYGIFSSSKINDPMPPRR